LKLDKKSALFPVAFVVSALAYLGSSELAKAASQLVINSMHADPAAKKAFEGILTKFKEENKDITVSVNTIDHESYKIQIRTWLPNNPPDVATWFAGNKAKFFVDKGLIEPIDDVWKPVENQFGEGAKASVTFGGKKYLLPATYYNWGIYYRKDLFEKAGIAKAPQTWAEFKDATAKLKAQNITPLAIGTKQSWPAAAWFDFLNMRVNGYAFHMALLTGKESYTDPKVKKAMGYWAELIKEKAFPLNAPAMTWQEAAGMLWQGKAGMYLMGNFIAGDAPQNMKGKLGFFAFPTIDPQVPSAEVAPTDVYFIPSKAKNKDNAKKFLSFLARSDVQQQYNELSKLLPPNKNAKVAANDELLSAGQALLANAQGISQFFDRDAEPEVAKIGLDKFVEFMAFPEKLDKILNDIDAVRKRVHKK
jgi:multiple sugar transport system substrate-binding protein